MALLTIVLILSTAANALTLYETPIEISVAASKPDVNAAGAVLMEATTGRVLMSVTPDARLPMASTTKIMTALVAIERGTPSDVVTVSHRASGITGSSMHLKPGERITLENLLYGLMLASGNDAAVAIAEHVGGSVEGFAELMNARANEIGAKNTYFVTPNGLHNDAHYTTARDLGLITREAMKNARFAELVSTQYYNALSEEGAKNRSLKNNNRILFQFDGGNGVKTGFTKLAGRCLVSAAKRGGMQLIAVVLNCGGMFPESMALLDYGFSAAAMRPLVKKGETIARIPVEGGAEKSLELRASRDIMVPLLTGEASRVERRLECPNVLNTPVKKGTTIATLSYTLEGKMLARFEFNAPKDLYRADMPYYLGKIIGQWTGGQ